MQFKLINLRKSKGITQQQVAAFIGCSLKNYNDKELGKRPFNSDEMFNIADYFGVPLTDIFLPRSPQNVDKM